MKAVTLLRAAPGWALLALRVCVLAQTPSIPTATGVVAAIPPATPAPDGHLIITAQRSEVFVPADGFIELKPSPIVSHSDFVARTLYLLIADQLAEQRHLAPGENFGTFRVDPPRGSSVKRVRIVALDDFCRPLELMQCTLRSWVLAPCAPVQIAPQGEALRIALEREKPLRAAYLFVDEVCLGLIQAQDGVVPLDMRGLEAGEHRVRVVAVNENGMLLPSIGPYTRVEPRFSVTALEPPGEIRVPADDPARTLAVNITRSKGVEATSALVYIAGQFITERDRPEFVAELPLEDAPTGSVTIEVVGVGKDGFLYPAETLSVPIKNLAWEARVQRRAEYTSITAQKTKMNRLEAEAVYWYARALRVPSFVASNAYDTVQPLGIFRRDIRLPYLKGLKTPGASSEYNARARKAVQEMAQIRLTLGGLYKSLRMWEMARSSFQRAAREAGDMTPTGQDAQTELKALEDVLKRRR